jgi:hypothetical protein
VRRVADVRAGIVALAAPQALDAASQAVEDSLVLRALPTQLLDLGGLRRRARGQELVLAREMGARSNRS